MSTALTKSERQMIAEIESGKFRDFYLNYFRQSTDEADNQKNSFEYQNGEIAGFFRREPLQIAPVTLTGFCTNGIIKERHSAFAENDDIIFTEDGKAQFAIERPKFQRLLLYLSKGYFKGVVCLSWDRLSRNKADEALIRKLMRKGVDFRFAYAQYEQTSSGELHMDIDGMFSAHHSRVTKEKVEATMRTKRNEAICTYRAPLGYLNLGEMEHKPLDPERAPIIKHMFELYATGDWNLSDLARWANEQGLTTIPMRRKRTEAEMLDDSFDIESIPQVSRPICVNAVSRMLKSRFYTGRTLDNEGKYVPSNSHEAIVDDELFDKVQVELKKKQTSIRYTKKLSLPLRGIVRCTHCGRVFTPYTQKGIQYFSSRCRDGCENTLRNFNFNFVAKKVGGIIAKLHFTDEEKAQLDERLGTDIALLEEKRHKELEQIERKKRKVREDLAYIRSNKLTLLKTGVYTPESLVDEEKRLSEELDTLQANESVSDAAMHETVQEVWKLSELVKDIEPTYSFASPHEKEEIIRLIFSELSISQNTLKFKCKIGFQCFENRLLTFGAQGESRTHGTHWAMVLQTTSAPYGTTCAVIEI